MHSIACPNCGKRLKLGAEQLKRKLRCSACPTRFIVGGQLRQHGDGSTEHLAIEVFDEPQASGHREASPIAATRDTTAPPSAEGAPATDKPVYSDNMFPDDFVGLVDEAPPAPPPPQPKAVPVQPLSKTPVVAPKPALPRAPVVRAKPIPPPRPAARPKTPPPPKPVPPKIDEFDLGTDAGQIDIHLEVRTPSSPTNMDSSDSITLPPPRGAEDDEFGRGGSTVKLQAHIPQKGSGSPPVPPKSPARTPAPAKPPAPPAVVFDEVEIIESPPATTPPIKTDKGGIPILEPASDDDIAEFEARRKGKRPPPHRG